MADEVDGQETASRQETAKETRWRKRLIAIGVILVILLGQVACSFVLIKKFIGPRLAGKTRTDVSRAWGQGTPPVAETADFHLLDGMVVDSVGRRGRQFFSVAVDLELDPGTQEAVAREIREKEPILHELVTNILSAEPHATLLDRNTLRAQLLEEISRRIIRGKIVGVHFARYITAYGPPEPDRDQARTISSYSTMPVLSVGR